MMWECWNHEQGKKGSGDYITSVTERKTVLRGEKKGAVYGLLCNQPWAAARAGTKIRLLKILGYKYSQIFLLLVIQESRFFLHTCDITGKQFLVDIFWNCGFKDMYRVFKHQVGFSKVAQLGTLQTKISKLFFSEILKMGNFCQVTIEKYSYSVTMAAWAEMWNRKNEFYTLPQCNVIYCSFWKGLRNPPKIIEKNWKKKLEIEQNYVWNKMEFILNSC